MVDNTPTPPSSPDTPIFTVFDASAREYSPTRPDYVFDGDWHAFCTFDAYDPDACPSEAAQVNTVVGFDPASPAVLPEEPLSWDDFAADRAFTDWYLSEMRSGALDSLSYSDLALAPTTHSPDASSAATGPVSVMPKPLAATAGFFNFDWTAIQDLAGNGDFMCRYDGELSRIDPDGPSSGDSPSVGKRTRSLCSHHRISSAARSFGPPAGNALAFATAEAAATSLRGSEEWLSPGLRHS